MWSFKALAVVFFVALQVRGGNADDEELVETILGLVDPLDSEPAINEFWWPEAESEAQSSGEHADSEDSDFPDSVLSDAQLMFPDSMGLGVHSAFSESMPVSSQLPMSEYDDDEEEETTEEPVMETETETVTETAPTVTVTVTDSSTSPTTKTSHTTSSSSPSSTSSTASTPSTVSSASSTSTTPTTPVPDPGAPTTTTTTTTTTTGVVEGSVQFEVSGDNVSAADIVDAYNNDPTGAYGEALARGIANASEDVGWQDVNITAVEVVIQNTTRRLESAHLRSKRVLTAAVNAAILVQYEILVSGTMGIDTMALADALGSEAAVTAIEAALTTELQQVDPSLTVSAVVVETVAVVPSTVTTTAEPSFAHRSVNWRTALLLGGGIATFFMLQH